MKKNVYLLACLVVISLFLSCTRQGNLDTLSPSNIDDASSQILSELQAFNDSYRLFFPKQRQAEKKY